jgi:Na+-translocating ferredoxin:NAD+ oxidoreductase subunit G
MDRRESTFINMVGSLLVVTLVSGGILGFVHAKTREAIEISTMKAQTDAISHVLPVFGELGKTVKVLPANSTDSIEIFPAYNERKLVGIAVKTWSDKGFSGHISVMAGLDTLGNVTGYEILEHKETPGLGSKMTTWFRNSEKPGQNVIGKNFFTTRFQVKKDGGDIDAITASTITSRAFLDALTRAHEAAVIFRPDTSIVR